MRQVSALRILFAGLMPDSPFSEIHARLQPFDSEAFRIACALSENELVHARLLAYEERLRRSQPVTTGDDLKALGLRPGPRYREILSQLRAAWLDGQVANSEEERRLLQRIVRQQEAE
jgi:tRNA nucleotidyltransferase (CCA-adding enzyme)